MISWDDWFYIDQNSNKLLWKVSRESANGIMKVFAGDEAGSYDAYGYLCVKLHNKKYKVHRVIWEMCYGEIPEDMQIDHINGIRDDNAASNLRLVTHAVNNRNRKVKSTNKTGVSGVQLVHRETHSFYIARWVTLDGKEKSKSFSLQKYPDAFIMACNHREKMIAELNELGAGYHHNHGNR